MNLPCRNPYESGKKPPHTLMRLTLRGLPELDLFESDAQREQAISEIGRHAGNLKSGGFWIGVTLFSLSAITILWVTQWLSRGLNWPAWAVDLVRFPVCFGAFFFVLRALHRWGTRAELRQILIAYGIPVCLSCGYSLRGLRRDSRGCPECGAHIPETTWPLIEVCTSARDISNSASD